MLLRGKGDAAREDDPRQRAAQAVAAIWYRAGRPGERINAQDISVLETILCGYLRFRFRDAVVHHDIELIVKRRLKVALPPLFLRLSIEGPSPEDLLNHLVDDVLDTLHPNQTTCPPIESEPNVARLDVSNGHHAADLLGGYDPSSVLAAMKQARAEGSILEIVVVTQYLDLCETMGEHPSWQEVAEKMLPNERISRSDVARLILNFVDRLGRSAVA